MDRNDPTQDFEDEEVFEDEEDEEVFEDREGDPAFNGAFNSW